MQDSKVYTLKNKKSGILNIVGYSDISFESCVDIKVSISCYILTLAYGSISWKSSKMILMASTMMQTIMWHVKRLSGRLCVKKVFPKIKVVDNISKPLTAL
jgi:hypothetical protein